MTRAERDRIMVCSGVIRGLAISLGAEMSEAEENDPDCRYTLFLRDQLLDISQDLESAAKGHPD